MRKIDLRGVIEPGLWARVVVVVVLVVIAVYGGARLLSMHSPPSEPLMGSVNGFGGIDGRAFMGVNESIYVIGPTLAQKLIKAGISQMIRQATLNQLPKLPNNSIIIIDWGVLYNYSGDNYSVIIGVLHKLIEGGDLVIIHTSSTVRDPAVAWTVAWAWAKAYDRKIAVYPAVNGYYVSAFGGKNVLVFGSGYEAKDVVGMIRNYQSIINVWNHKAESSQALLLGIYELYELQSMPLTNVDPCQKYVQQASSLGGVVFDYEPNYNGIYTEAYGDGNGTFYYDACIFVYNGNGEPYIPAGAGPYYSVATAAWMAYMPSSTMIDNNGYINYFIGTMDHNSGWSDYQSGYNAYLGIPVNSYLEYGSGANPASTSSNYVTSFTVTFGTGGISIAFQVEYAESPSSTKIDLENTAQTTNTAAVNNTWQFYMGGDQQAGQKYMASFAEDANEWALPQGLNIQQTATFYNELGANLVTSIQNIPCAAWIYNYEVIWTKILWVLQYSPRSSQPTGFNAQIMYPESPYYVTGVSSYSTSIPYFCGDTMSFPVISGTK